MKNKLLLSLIGGALLCASLLTVHAGSDALRSTGRYEISNKGRTVVLDAADLDYLQQSMSDLEYTYKSGTLTAIQGLQDVAVHNDLDLVEAEEATSLDFETYIDTITQSQDALLGDNIATAANLSSGYGAYIKGNYLHGTGADVNAAYAQGRSDGINYTSLKNNISYTYHQHINGAGAVVTVSPLYATSNPGGCYKAAGHTHNVTGTCGYYYTSHTHSGSCYHSETVTETHGGYSASEGTYYPERTVSYTVSVEHCGGQPLNSGAVYTCGYPVNTYVWGCGRTAGVTIDQAVIHFDKAAS